MRAMIFVFEIHFVVPAQALEPGLDYVTVLINNNASLSCSFLSYPAPSIEWHFMPFEVAIANGGQYSIYDTSSSLYMHSSTLSISNVDSSNAGVYRCSASNTLSGGNSTNERVLRVYGKTSWSLC